jgi:hypothetical protein
MLISARFPEFRESGFAAIASSIAIIGPSDLRTIARGRLRVGSLVDAAATTDSSIQIDSRSTASSLHGGS